MEGTDFHLKELLTPAVLGRLDGCALAARTVVEGVLAGLHRSVTRGAGGEFVQYDPYLPGDDIRHLDWKLYARSGRLCRKIFQAETEMRCAILVDASGSMAYKGKDALCSKYGYAALLASCFAYLALKQGDRPAVFAYSETTHASSGTDRRLRQLPELLSALEEVVPDGIAQHEDALAHAENFLGRRRGLVLLISDLWGLDDSLEKIVRRNHFAGRDCLVCRVLDNDEITLPFDDTRRFVDSESGETITTAPPLVREEYERRVKDHLEKMRNICLENQADYLQALSSESPGELLASFLKKR